MIDPKLDPAKINIDKFERVGKIERDRFGQIYNTDPDKAKWSDKSPVETRKDHSRSDVDLSRQAQHHTLGPKANQASPGDHTHDGLTSVRIGPTEPSTIKPDPNNPATWTKGGPVAVWTIPTNPTVADLVVLLSNFVNFREV
jgi:hypothetical protein